MQVKAETSFHPIAALTAATRQHPGRLLTLVLVVHFIVRSDRACAPEPLLAGSRDHRLRGCPAAAWQLPVSAQFDVPTVACVPDNATCGPW